MSQRPRISDALANSHDSLYAIIHLRAHSSECGSTTFHERRCDTNVFRGRRARLLCNSWGIRQPGPNSAYLGSPLSEPGVRRALPLEATSSIRGLRLSVTEVDRWRASSKGGSSSETSTHSMAASSRPRSTEARGTRSTSRSAWTPTYSFARPYSAASMNALQPEPSVPRVHASPQRLAVRHKCRRRLDSGREGKCKFAPMMARFPIGPLLGHA